MNDFVLSAVWPELVWLVSVRGLGLPGVDLLRLGCFLGVCLGGALGGLTLTVVVLGFGGFGFRL